MRPWPARRWAWVAALIVASVVLLGPAPAALADGGQIAGVVSDSSGAPLAGIDVYAYDAATGYRGPAVTAADGSYALTDLPSGSYPVQFSSPQSDLRGYVNRYYGGGQDQLSAVAVSVTDGQTTGGIDAQLDPAGAISGRVIDADGTPLDNVVAAAEDLGTVQTSVAVTYSDGRYTIPGLEPGVYRVSFDGDGFVTEYYDQQLFSWPPDLVTVTAGEITSGIDGQLHQGGSISGTVTDTQGRPLAGATAMLDKTGQWSPVDADGHYTIRDVEPGDWVVRFEQPPGTYVSDPLSPAPDFSASATVAAGATTTGVNARLPTGAAVSGTVTDAAGQPLAGVTVSLAFAHQTYENSYGDAANPPGVKTDAEGHYTLSGIASQPGLRVWFSGGDYVGHYYGAVTGHDAATLVTLTEGQTTTGIDTTMTPGGKITGRVLTYSGQPETNAFVYAYDSAGTEDGFALPDANGAYAMTRLAAGTDTVEFAPHDGLAIQFYDGETVPAAADLVHVAAGATVTGVDAELATVAVLAPLGPIAPTPTPASAPQPAAPAVSRLALDRYTGRLAVTRAGMVTVRLRCTGSATCPASTSITAAAPSPLRSHRRARPITIAARLVRVSAGRASQVALRLSATGRSLLRRGHGRLTATITLAPATAGAASTSAVAQLRSARA